MLLSDSWSASVLDSKWNIALNADLFLFMEVFSFFHDLFSAVNAFDFKPICDFFLPLPVLFRFGGRVLSTGPLYWSRILRNAFDCNYVQDNLQLPGSSRILLLQVLGITPWTWFAPNSWQNWLTRHFFFSFRFSSQLLFLSFLAHAICYKLLKCWYINDWEESCHPRNL